MMVKKIIYSFVTLLILFSLAAAFHSAKASDLLAEETATIKTLKKVIPATVSIVIYQIVPETSLQTGLILKRKIEVGQGTGFIVSADGLIITNRHVADKTGEFKVFLANGDSYAATVLAMDKVSDIALLKIEAKKLSVVTMGNSDNLQVGQTVLAIGNALGKYQSSVTRGIVSGLSRFLLASDGTTLEKLEDVIQTDAAINVGNSGGPLVNLKGEVIGLNVAVEAGAQSIGFAINVNEVKKVMDSYKKFGLLKRAFLGVRYQMIDGQLKEEYGLVDNEGALAIKDEKTGAAPVVVGSAAESAGLQEGDIIKAINKKVLTKNNPLRRAILKFWPNDKITLTIKRDNSVFDKIVILGDYPEM